MKKAEGHYLILMRVNITSNKIPSNKIPSNKVSRSLSSDDTLKTQHFCGILGGGGGGAKRGQNVLPESNNWETLAKSKLKDILQNN